MDNIKEKQNKRERYLLKRQRKEEERFNLNRRKKTKKILRISFLILIVVGLLVGTGYLIAGFIKDSSEESYGTPKIEISPREYRAGDVSITGGLFKHTYEIKNMGDGDLKIDRIWTSCMCTTARLTVGDKESGEFGMHDKSILWSQKISPGETGFLEVTFDPAFHGDQGFGNIVRVIYISSNDSQNKKTEARLIVNVIE